LASAAFPQKIKPTWTLFQVENLFENKYIISTGG